LAVAHLLEYLLWLAGWWLVGQGILQGRLDRGWLFGWVLLLLTTIPLRQCAIWWQGLVAIAAGRILKLRLLAGALRLQADEIRHQGSGQLLGRVIESQTVESWALSGGFLVLTAAIELIVTAGVLAQGAGGVVHALLLPFWWRSPYSSCGVIGAISKTGPARG
jgi:ATP-binding cassette subfamily B protein